MAALGLIVFLGFALAAIALIIGGILLLRRGDDAAGRAIGLALIVAGVVLPLGLLGIVYFDLVLPSLLVPIALAFGFFAFIIWIAALVDCAVNETDAANERLLWVLIILFAQFIGAVLYLLIRRPRRLAEQRR